MLSSIGAGVYNKIFNSQDAQDIWSTLNQSIDGRLQTSTPFALPCFSSYNGKQFQGDPAECSSIQENYNSSLFRSEFFNGYMNFLDEICASIAGDACLLDNSDPWNDLAYYNVSCNQGSVPEHYIDVQGPHDVIEAFKFAKKNEVRLSIKNSGSTNSGRNSLKGSLGLWVRHLNNISYDQSFIPEGCDKVDTAQMSVTIEAGVNNGEIMEYSEIHNFIFAGAYADVVGVSGGWVQGGGEGVLSPVYGLGADRVMQYKIVTPDGKLRIANACQNQDLFWALRGGGGGTFGVVLESIHKVEETSNPTVANITFPALSTNYLPFVERIINSTAQWAQEGWGGNINPGSFVTVTPLLSLTQATKSLKSIIDFAYSRGGTAVLESLTYHDFYNKFVRPFPPPIGTQHVLSTRLIPTTMFKTSAGRAKMLSFLHYHAEQDSYAYIMPVGPVLFPHVTSSTSYTPAWLNSVWLLGLHPPQWTWNSTVAQKREVVEATRSIDKSLEELTPGSGTHSVEADPFTRDWRRAFWGENYEPLVQVKRKYDPDRLLSCWRCMEFEEEDNEEFECYHGVDGGRW